MLKKLNCFILIIIIAFSAASCTRKADTTPLSSAVSVSEDSGEVTTSASAESKKEKSDKKSKKAKKSTSEKADDSQKKKSETKKATSKAEKNEKSQKKSSQSKKNATKKAQSKKSTPKKTAPKKSGDKKGQTTTKKQSTAATKSSSVSVKITVDCTAAVGKVDGIPNYYLNGFEIELEAGATAFTATKAACAKAGVSLTATKTMYGEYISAIGSLAEKATSRYSGWTYTVNGTYPPKAADKYTLENGDTIKWIYKA